ncbi:MAG: ketoacyl-ACP synthase III [Thaumarchaeota archaeon]|nr:ketoacyl-ACP synthase III [Nitrososphaerota archaeon]
MSNRYARVSSVGHYLPKLRMTNEEASKRIGVQLDPWLSTTTGITVRHISAVGETTSDLAVAAAREALEQANLRPDDIDMLLLATDTPDYISPPTTCVIHQKLGMKKKTGAFDINAACADPAIALDLASRYIMTDSSVNRVLCTSAYTMTKYLDWKDSMSALFSDGAGAVIVERSDEPGFMSSKIIADGSYQDYWGIYCGASYERPTVEAVQAGRTNLKLLKRYPPDVNIANWPDLIRDALAKSKMTLEDIDMFLFTQVNLSMIKSTMTVLGQPLERTHWIMNKWGYTGSSCVYLALYDALELGKIMPGDNVVFCTSGVGYVMAADVFHWV